MFGHHRVRHLIPCLLALTLLIGTGCTSLMRGFQQNQFVSNGYPALTASSNLPMTLNGKFSPMLLSDMQFITPQTWLAVYGAQTPQDPMALIAYAVAPNLYQWDLASASVPDSPVTSEVAFGGHNFSGSLHILNAANDPFGGYAATTPEQAANTFWLVQRYANLSDFRKTKIVLEYREPLPEPLRHLADSSPAGISWTQNTPEVRAFIQRAEAAFTLQFAFDGASVTPSNWLRDIPQINMREMGRFLGSLSLIDPFPKDFGSSDL